MMCCSGAPKSPRIATRLSTAAAPTISRRSSRPRSCSSCVSIPVLQSCLAEPRSDTNVGGLTTRTGPSRKSCIRRPAAIPPDPWAFCDPDSRAFPSMTSAAASSDQRSGRPHGSLGALALGALGVVYGDIGTSPLYTMKTALETEGGKATAEVALGMLSLVVWTLIITTSVKYVAVVMRADNEGEGGILALMSLLGIRHGARVGVIAAGILGAALLYGDGAITPAISVLSALEGLKTAAPAIAPWIVTLAVAILVALFALQPQGSARVGKLFGPIMAFWFVTIAVLGLIGLIRHPEVLKALDPRYGASLLFTHDSHGFLVLGAVFLCATGAEALYADMGHFGPRPIRVSWYGLVLPALALNYAGQTGIILVPALPEGANPFYERCPP